MSSAASCGLSLLVDLPDDVFAIISRSLSPRDICNLTLCCNGLNALTSSEKLWLTQCEVVGVVPPKDLVVWRKAVLSYKALCRFLVNVKPLLGIWVHQNPELGNVVYVMPGFVSVVGCRIIPQELGPLGMDNGPILWAPVFEVLGDDDGSTAFILHGRELDHNYIYPGSVRSIEKTCNVLLLEVEPRKQDIVNLLHGSNSRSIDHPISVEEDVGKRTSESGSTRSRRFSEEDAPTTVPFRRLCFGDRRKLLEIATSQVRFEVSDSADGPLFPCSQADEEKYEREILQLTRRRSLIMRMHKFGVPSSLPAQLDLDDIRKLLDRSSEFRNSLISMNDDTRSSQCAKRRTLGDYVKDSLRQVFRRSNSNGTIPRDGYSNGDSKHARLHEFLSSGDTIGLTFRASTMKLSSYRAWPDMHETRFALYKMPMQVPVADQEYAGLWGGAFGWPPGSPSEDKPGKALFFLVASYHEESPGQRLLIATKILEGTHYVLHPNGSAMFIVNVNEPSDDQFYWSNGAGAGAGADAPPVHVKHAFSGEGIANGYGFRFPGSKPGSLFVLEDEMLVFQWKESKAILALQRLNLQDLLKKGRRVPALPAIANFSYLTKSYSNVFSSFANMGTSFSSLSPVKRFASENLQLEN
ncbi:hypothetical protein Dimus_012002 [Dionaea muscipula]